ncbi:hypothetical protein SEPCBS57363_003622 [Sporothrix epigloea]|uniref:Tho complex subunit 7 n=1 Tax=Sporothrix epigloea TaxID=1892477 RepID=A0ABP0DR48_9PEZI
MAYQLLDPRDEEELFKSRLLNVEEKPFKRITKRLATLSRVVATAGVQQEQTPPPETEGGGETIENTENLESSGTDNDRSRLLAEIAQLREDVTLDFAAFDASIARLQFLAAANARERARYAERRITIEDTCRNVRDDVLVSLRSQLESARATLQQRQVFDGLADRITSSKTLWQRPEQQATIDKLEDECQQLQRESEAYTATWRERKQQFARIMDESMRLRRLIRDEKDEVERREGMDDEDALQGQTSATTGASHIAAGAVGTAGDKTPLSVAGATHGASAPDMDGTSSPAPTETYDGDKTLRPETVAATAASRDATPAPTIAVDTPAPTADGGEDADMAEADQMGDTAPAQDTEDISTPGAETPAEGTPTVIADDAPAGLEKMDTT